MNAVPAEIEKLRQSGCAEGKSFSSTLDFDKFILVRHDNVEVNVCCRVLRIVEVEHWRTLDHADAHGGDVRADWILSKSFRRNQLLDGHAHRDKRACDRRRTRTAVGFD